MKEVFAKKLYKGKYVSVNDYMVLSPSQLPKGILNPTIFFSAFNSQTYRLIDYVWKPDADQMEFDSVEKESNKPNTTSFSYF